MLKRPGNLCVIRIFNVFLSLQIFPMCRFLSILWLFSILPCLSLHAQEPVYRNYSVENGLPSSEVFHVLQDSKGYIWFATNMGVSRFDGKTFKNFDIQDGIPENTVFEVFEDAKQRLWFVSFPFQLSYYENDSIIPYRYNSRLGEIANEGQIPVKKSFMVDSDERIIFSFVNDGRIFELDKYGKSRIRNQVRDSSVFVAISKINHKLFVGQAYSGEDTRNIRLTYKAENTEKTFTIPRHQGNHPFGNYLADITENSELLFAYNKMFTILRQDGTYRQTELPSRAIWMKYMNNGILWIGTEANGALKYQIKTEPCKQLENYLDGKAVSSTLHDSEGGLWLSTLEKGVFYFSSKAFISYTEKDGFTDAQAYTLEFHKDKLYIGANSYQMYILENGKLHKTDIGNDNKIINVLASFDDETLWIGARSNLFSMDQHNLKRFQNNHPKAEKRLPEAEYSFGIKSIYPLGNNMALLGQMRSLSLVKDGNVIYDSYFDDDIGLRVEAIEKQGDSSFLLGTFNGLWSYHDGKISYLGNQSTLYRRRITSIIKLNDNGDYALGTKGSGLVIKYKGRLMQLTTRQGLSSNSITSVIKLGDTLLAATNNGLNILKLEEALNNVEHVIILKKEHGLVSNEINQIKSDGRRVYIAANGGVTVFDLSEYKSFKAPSPIYIQRFRVNNEDLKQEGNLSLSHNQNFLTISFTGINFRDADNLFYKYRLVGLSDEWTTTRNQEVEYAFLPPGKYHFEVVAINSEGFISNKPATIGFEIRYPFWQTWWFIAIVLMLVVLSVITMYKHRLRTVEAKHEVQNDIIKYRQQALLRQMDPHFVFNTLNSIQSFIIKNDSRSSSFYLTKFSKLMRIILNNSRRQTVRLNDEIDALNLYMELESLRFPEKFTFSITYPQNLDTDLIKIPAFIVQPFIENAIWHGILNLKRPGVIKVNYEIHDNYLVCTIEDNGIGRKQAKKMASDLHDHKESMGIDNVRTRLNLLSINLERKLSLRFTDLYSADGTPAGTKVTVEMPVVFSKKDNYE